MGKLLKGYFNYYRLDSPLALRHPSFNNRQKPIIKQVAEHTSFYSANLKWYIEFQGVRYFFETWSEAVDYLFNVLIPAYKDQ